MQTEEPNQQSIPDRLGRFRVREKLGEDAFGVIYLAEAEAAGESDRERGPVRVRVLPEAVHLDAERRARVVADVQRAVQVENPGLATVLELEDEPRGLLLVSARTRGRTLRAYLEDRKRLDLAETLRIGQELSGAIAALHRAGVVHGVLSDERVTIDDTGRVQVIDVGLAEVVRPAPESGLELDARSDVYAIAAMLFESLSGTRVSTNERSSDPPETLPALDPALGAPDALATLLQRATSAERAERPADADALQAALAAIDLPSEPIGEQVAESRKSVLQATSNTWIIGASIAIALVVTLVIVLATSGP